MTRVCRPLTADEIAEAQRLLNDGASYCQVARSLGRAHATIARRFPGYSFSVDTTDRDAQVAELTRKGLSLSEIAEVVNTTTRTVSRSRHRMGINKPPNTLMTQDEIARAKLLLDDGASYQEVERTIGRCAAAIKRNLPGYTWTKEQCKEHLRTIRAFNASTPGVWKVNAWIGTGNAD